MISCTSNKNTDEIFSQVAEDYVKLVLEVGQYDSYFVDAYYGPKEWKPKELTNENTEIPSEDMIDRIENLNQQLKSINLELVSENELLRHTYLTKQLKAVKGRIEMLSGKTFTFDEETQVLYDVVTPDYSIEHFQLLIDELDNLLPGDGSLTDRYTEFKEQFIIPKDKLDTVFHIAIKEARKRT